MERPRGDVPERQLHDPRRGVPRRHSAALRLPPVPRVHQEAVTMRNQRGMSLVEIVTTLAIVSVLMLIVYAMMDDAMRAAMFGESHNDMTIMTQRAVNRLQTEVLQSRVA